MNKDKEILKEQKRLKKQEKQKIKMHKKRVKQLKNILDWMHIQKINEYGIYLSNGKQDMIARGLILSSNNIFLSDSYQSARYIYALSSGLDYLNGQIFFKFVETPIKLSSNINRFSNQLEREKNQGRRNLLKLQIDKMEMSMEKFNEISFYVLIQDQASLIDKRLYQLKEVLRSAGLNPQYMGVTDYEAVISQQFENDTVNEYMHTSLIIDEEVYDRVIEEERISKKNSYSA